MPGFYERAVKKTWIDCETPEDSLATTVVSAIGEFNDMLKQAGVTFRFNPVLVANGIV